MVEDADLRDGRTVGGNRGYCVDRPAQPITHHLCRVNTLASSHGQNYIRLPGHSSQICLLGQRPQSPLNIICDDGCTVILTVS